MRSPSFTHASLGLFVCVGMCLGAGRVLFLAFSRNVQAQLNNLTSGATPFPVLFFLRANTKVSVSVDMNMFHHAPVLPKCTRSLVQRDKLEKVINEELN